MDTLRRQTADAPMAASIKRLSLILIGLLLFGYVVGNKGFAHISVPPVFIGEVVLGLSLMLFMLAPDFRVVMRLPQVWLLLAFVAWCAFQTFPYLGEYGFDALRDAAMYGYSLFGLLIAAYMHERALLERACLLYDRAMTLAILFLPLLLLVVDHSVSTSDDMSLVFLKSGDTAVHLAGVLAFRLIGLRSAVKGANTLATRVLDVLFWVCWASLAIWVASVSRGALLALISGAGMMALLGHGRRQVATALVLLTLALGIVSLLSLRIEQDRRDISVEQIIDNATSIFGGDMASNGDLASTAAWRLNWWGIIVDYTLFGEYFWSGKGFGINLSLDDRGSAGADGQLRSPHNGHLTVLARAGVPGLLLWAATMTAFAVALARRSAQLRKAGLVNWSKLNAWVLSYWSAAMVNATFDVYLEGPQGGIWFWSIFGFGLAVLGAERSLDTRYNAAAPAPRVSQ